MNYLGHAWVALAETDDPARVLGSMLPDFATMARARLEPQTHPEVARGVALHLATDDAFHDDPRFLRLVTEVTAELSARGVERGPARAVGHIGVELLIDGELVAHESVREAYMGALNAAPGLPLALRQTDHEERLGGLIRRLHAYGPPWDYARPEGVTGRLFLALQGRPRLRPRPADAQPIEAVLRDAQARLRGQVEGILHAVQVALQQQPAPR